MAQANFKYTEYDRDALHRLTKHLKNLKHAKIYSLALTDIPRRVRFIIMCPEANQICPITHDEIAASAVEYPADVFSHNRTGIRLSCGHDFTGLSLLFHWVYSGNINCPLCRAGPPDDSLGVLPMRLRTHLSRREFDMMPMWQLMEEYKLHCKLEGVNIPRQFTPMEFTEVGDNIILTARGPDVEEFLKNTPVIRLTIVIESEYYDDKWPTVWFHACKKEYSYMDFVYRIDNQQTINFTISSFIFKRTVFIHEEIRWDLPMSEVKYVRESCRQCQIAYATPPPQPL